MLTLKDVTPVRLIKNKFFHTIHTEILGGASVDKQREILGRGRAKKGMFEGNLEEGELEIGQVSGLIDSIESVDTIMSTIITEYKEALADLQTDNYLFND